MLKPIEIEKDGVKHQISCKFKAQWPPGWARSGFTAEELRAKGLLTLGKLEQGKTWEKVCGIMKMEASKCSQCPNAVGEDGKNWVTPEVVTVPMRYSPHKRKQK